MTFQDVSDTVNVERALVERNEALIAADGIKIEFVHHVSYELRSPLTNIIGFANLLGDPAFGPLTDKQHEYLGYITTSTNALLAIINNILDLATIDAGAMTLNLSEVDIRACMEAAAEGVLDRLVKNHLKLEIQTSPGIGSFRADEQRLRQVLFNLLSNAIGFSPEGAAVTLAAQRTADAVLFTVIDRGPGIPPEAKERSVRLGSKRTRRARSIVAQGWDCRWCVLLSNCTAAASRSIPLSAKAPKSSAYSRSCMSPTRWQSPMSSKLANRARHSLSANAARQTKASAEIAEAFFSFKRC